MEEEHQKQIGYLPALHPVAKGNQNPGCSSPPHSSRRLLLSPGLALHPVAKSNPDTMSPDTMSPDFSPGAECSLRRHFLPAKAETEKEAHWHCLTKKQARWNTLHPKGPPFPIHHLGSTFCPHKCHWQGPNGSPSSRKNKTDQNVFESFLKIKMSLELHSIKVSQNLHSNT